MSDHITDKGFGESAECNKDNSETNGLACNSSEHISAAVSDSGDEDVPIVRSKKRVQQFSDSDVDSGEEGQNGIPNVAYASSDTASKLPEESYTGLSEKPNAINSDDDVSYDDFNKSSHTSQLQKVSTSSNSIDSNDGEIVTTTSPGNGRYIRDSRVKNKRDMLRENFESLATKRLKENKSDSDSDSNSLTDKINSDAPQSSEDEASSVIKIKQKIKEKRFQIKSSICDPDTSDDEGSMARAISKPKKEMKSVKPTSPKPIRMSAKQAMENMHKIKSESNRMLREKEVSLPYHRPKALSLKDILSKRRPAVSADGKTLPIKMNEEQLRQYAQQLEQRQREVIELCKSESEDEPDEPKENEDTETDKENKSKKDNPKHQEMETLNDTIYDDLSKNETTLDTKVEDNIKVIKTNSDEHAVTENSILVRKMDVDAEKFKPLQMGESEPEGDYVKSTSLDSNKNTDNDNDKNNSADMELVYNDSVEESGVADTDIDTSDIIIEKSKNLDAANEIAKPNTEVDSQLISLKYDITEKIDDSKNLDLFEIETHEKPSDSINNEVKSLNGDFSDDDINMDDIDALIENAEISTNRKSTAYLNSPMLITEHDLMAKPKLTGAPGMVIDLDGTDPLVPRKLTGVELLKERFVFFAKLKTPEELERENEKTLKPGALHLKLKQELEEQIAEQRSLEWAKRLEEEKQHKAHESVKKVESDAEDIDDIEAKLEEREQDEKESSPESEEEAIEYDIIDKPRKRNPMVDDEAEESDCDEIPEGEDDDNDDSDEGDGTAKEDEGNEAGVEDNDDEDETESSSDESEEEQEEMTKKGRILKAFEDSDDEDKLVPNETATMEKTDPESKTKLVKDTQDDVIQLAQKSQSEDLFTSQDSKTTKSSKVDIVNTQDGSCFEDKGLGTQTFSILEGTAKENVDIGLSIPDKLPMTCDAPVFDENLDAVVGMCSGSFSQNLVPPSLMTDVPASQVIGEDVLALCTGQFYDNQFVSQDYIGNGEILQTDKAETLTFDVAMSPKESYDGNPEAMPITNNRNELIPNDKTSSYKENGSNKQPIEDSNLKSILDELNNPEFDLPKPNKYFVSNMEGKENNSSVANAQFKKKFVIDSDDDEQTEDIESSKNVKKKKKKNMKQRALQISDDEEDDVTDEDDEFEYEEVEEDEQRIVEYDSDENEVIVQPQNTTKKRKTAEFFENEAELTSEDEWIGSGDEDEAGLDRMEREAGDEDTFNQNQLQRELGQIHMRDVLDQDKREVRMIQELLFEDGDLGAGSRQRKFRWKDVDGEDENGAGADELADTQEDEAESEEQWRKQRHEREIFLRSLNKEDAATETISFNRTSFIKANLSKNCSNISVEVNTSVEKTESPAPEKKTAKDIPSPKKPFGIFQQNYHGSLLARGQDALSRLATLATPLATDDYDAPKAGSMAPTNKRNFVFATVDTTKDDELKVIKRKAEASVGTPRLVKRLRTEEKQKQAKASILDHLKV